MLTESAELVWAGDEVVALAVADEVEATDCCAFLSVKHAHQHSFRHDDSQFLRKSA